MIFSVIGGNYTFTLKQGLCQRWQIERRIRFQIKTAICGGLETPDIAYQCILNDVEQCAALTLISLEIPYIAVLSCKDEEEKYKRNKYREIHRYLKKRAISCIYVDRIEKYITITTPPDTLSSEKIGYRYRWLENALENEDHYGLSFYPHIVCNSSNFKRLPLWTSFQRTPSQEDDLPF